MPVYFIRAGEDGPVKIGKANNVASRLRELQCGNHLELTLLRTIDGGRQVELALHRRYEHLRSRGEWFAFQPDMLVVALPDLPVVRVESPLLVEIEAHLALTGMSPTAFGRKAVGDASFISDLRSGGRDMRLSTVERVREYIAQQERERAA